MRSSGFLEYFVGACQVSLTERLKMDTYVLSILGVKIDINSHILKNSLLIGI